jgi:hypothetical protein
VQTSEFQIEETVPMVEIWVQGEQQLQQVAALVVIPVGFLTCLTVDFDVLTPLS